MLLFIHTFSYLLIKNKQFLVYNLFIFLNKKAKSLEIFIKKSKQEINLNI